MAVKLNASFTNKIDRELDPVLNAIVQEREKLANDSQQAAFANPTDVFASRLAITNTARLGDFLALRSENELKLRAEFEGKINKERAQIFADIEAAAKDWRAQLAGAASGDISNSTRVLREPIVLPTVSLASQREALNAFKAEILAVHQAHSDSLRAMDEYINRPSGLRLFLSGAFDEAKGKLSSLSSKLGPLAKLINVDGLLNAGGEALNAQASKLEKKLSNFEEEMPGFIDGLIKKTTPKVSTPKGAGK